MGKGTPVRLRPSRRADAHDLFYRDQEATVAGVFRDVDGTVQVAVVLDDDPAREELFWQGRYLFFHPDEMELRGAPVERCPMRARGAVAGIGNVLQRDDGFGVEVVRRLRTGRSRRRAGGRVRDPRRAPGL